MLARSLNALARTFSWSSNPSTPLLLPPPRPPPSQDVLRRLLESDGRGEDAVKLEAQKLLNAFHINVLL